jgi:cytochrome c553
MRGCSPRSSKAALCAAALLSACSALAAPAAEKVPDTIAERVVPCLTCHGKEGRAGPDGYFPRIAGKPAGYLRNQLVNFREGRRHYPLMTYLVDRLTDEYLLEMAEYFAALDLPYPPPQATTAPREVLSRGEALVRRGDAARNIPACEQCHGPSLTGVNPGVPGLLGLPHAYLYAQLGRWRTGLRRALEPDCMAKIAARLTAQDVGAVSAWLSSQTVPANSKPAAAHSGPSPIPCGSAAK